MYILWLCATVEAAPIVINELMPDASGEDQGHEWIELFNPGPDPVDLAGWTLEAGTSAPEVRYTWTEGVLRPGAHLVVGEELVPEANLVVPELSLGNASSSADLVRLVRPDGAVADTVVYGSPNTDGFPDDRGSAAESLAPVPMSGASLARLPDGADSDACGDDFGLALTPSPGEPNEVAPVTTCEADGEPARDVVINEVLPDPDGEDDGLEWLELYNAGEADRALDGWTLAFGTRDYESVDLTFPPDTVLGAGEFLVVGGELVAGAAVVGGFSIGNGTGTDGIRLADCAGASIDTVLYGEAPNDDGLLDDLGVAALPYGDPEPDQVLARVEDGADSDRATDWLVVGLPTPGGPNEIPAGGSGAPDPGCHPDAPATSEPVGCGIGGTTGAAAVLPLLIRLRRRR